jgi:hypothetical protein
MQTRPSIIRSEKNNDRGAARQAGRSTDDPSWMVTQTKRCTWQIISGHRNCAGCAATHLPDALPLIVPASTIHPPPLTHVNERRKPSTSSWRHRTRNPQMRGVKHSNKYSHLAHHDFLTHTQGLLGEDRHSCSNYHRLHSAPTTILLSSACKPPEMRAPHPTDRSSFSPPLPMHITWRVKMTVYRLPWTGIPPY